MDRRTTAGGSWIAVLALLASTAFVPEARAQFPALHVWAYPGAYQASGADSIQEKPRTITLRWMRDPDAEARPDFGGYRIYRVFHQPDTSSMMLIRRFSKQTGGPGPPDSLFMWHFPNIDANTPDADRIATFIDPDSSGTFFKVCRQVDSLGRCRTPGDSVIKIIPPPGPHDGFRTWYSVTYEAKNIVSNDYLDMFIPDTLNCPNPDPDRGNCPNLNGKWRNLTAVPVEPTSGPTANLQRVSVVPNPYRGAEVWDPAGGNEVHFINLPAQAKISIYTSAGDLVAVLEHNDPVRDFERWDLKNQSGRDVSSGIYMYRIESETFSFQQRFVVIR